MIPDVILDAVAAYRLTRLVTADDLTLQLREAWIEAAYRQAHRRAEAVVTWGSAGTELQAPGFWEDVVALDADPPKLATLITCRWCAGMWVGLGVVAVRRYRWWRQIRDALVLGSASALLARLEDG